MDEAKILTTILMFGIVFGLAIRWLVNNIIVNVKNIKAMIENNKLYTKKQAEVEKMKANGDFHEWVTVPTPGGTMLVCKKTGYCPELDGFVPLEMINSYLAQVKREEEYKVFRDVRVSILAKELNLDVPRMEEIVEKIFSMKKDFTVLQLAKLSEDLTKRAADIGNKQS